VLVPVKEIEKNNIIIEVTDEICEKKIIEKKKLNIE